MQAQFPTTAPYGHADNEQYRVGAVGHVLGDGIESHANSGNAKSSENGFLVLWLQAFLRYLTQLRCPKECSMVFTMLPSMGL